MRRKKSTSPSTNWLRSSTDQEHFAMHKRALACVTFAILAATAPGCRDNAASPTAKSTAHQDYWADNMWVIDIRSLGGRSNIPAESHFTAPQSTAPQSLLDRARGVVAAACGDDIQCSQGALYYFNLEPDNARHPPPPEEPFSPATVRHFAQGLKVAVTFVNNTLWSSASAELSTNVLFLTQNEIHGAVRNPIANLPSQKQRTIDDFSKKLRDKATPIVGKEMAELAADKGNVQAIRQLLDIYTADIGALNVEFATLTQAYQGYRQREPEMMATLLQVSNQASSADLTNFGAVQDALLALDALETSLPEQLIIVANSLSRRLASYQQVFDQQLESYRDFLAAKKFEIPNATRLPITSLTAIQDYCLARKRNCRQAMLNIMDGLHQRVQALALQAADSASLPARVAAQQLAASTDFVNESNQRTSALWQTPPNSNALNLPYLSMQFDRVVTFLGMEALCSGSNIPPYMQTGCKLLQPQFSRAHSYMNTGLASNIRLDLYFMGQANVGADKIAAVQADIAAGNLSKAVLDHDSILRAQDVPIPPSSDGSGNTDGGTVDDTGEDD
jgi:hypothetical protein